MSDPVNKPSHYNQGGIETIDSIRASTGDGFIWYCVGNADKYIGRCRYKGKLLEDLRKCRNYVDWAIAEAEKLEAAGESGNCPVMPDSSSRKPIAIPAGWRELEPDEVPLATDMHEWMGGWFYRNDDATNEYKWHSSRHIRKIETDERKQPAIPDGWRELEPDEFPRVTDMYESEGAWRNRINDSSIEYARYDVRQIRKIETDEPKPIEIPEGYRELTADDFIVFGDLYDDGDRWLQYTYNPSTHKNVKYSKSFHKRIIRKIEKSNPSETPNSSTWIPKVGDKVRVVDESREAVIEHIGESDQLGGLEHPFLVKHTQGGFRRCRLDNLQLIEAAQ